MTEGFTGAAASNSKLAAGRGPGRRIALHRHAEAAHVALGGADAPLEDRYLHHRGRQQAVVARLAAGSPPGARPGVWLPRRPVRPCRKPGRRLRSAARRRGPARWLRSPPRSVPPSWPLAAGPSSDQPAFSRMLAKAISASGFSSAATSLKSGASWVQATSSGSPSSQGALQVLHLGTAKLAVQGDLTLAPSGLAGLGQSLGRRWPWSRHSCRPVRACRQAASSSPCVLRRAALPAIAWGGSRFYRSARHHTGRRRHNIPKIRAGLADAYR